MLGEVIITNIEFNKKVASLNDAYLKKWGYLPNFKDYGCSKEEYIIALKTAIFKGVELADIIKCTTLGETRIKNKALKNSLQNNTSNNRKDALLKNQIINQKNTKAVRNIEKIKNRTAAVDASKNVGEHVVAEIKELRTVQSNKRLQKTRRSVIVRENKERGPKTPLQAFFNLMSFVAIGLTATFLGIFVGNMYIASKNTINYNYDENDYLLDYASIYSKNKNSNPATIASEYAYAMAEWQLISPDNLIDNYTIEGDGYVTAKVVGITQKQTVIKKASKSGSSFTSESITDGLIPAAEKLEVNLLSGDIKSYVTKKVSSANRTADYNAKPSNTYNFVTNMEEYRKIYGIKPNATLPYLVGNSETIVSKEYVGNEDSLYKHKITLHNIYGVINYVVYMQHISGLANPPTFYQLSLEFTVDSSYRMHELYVYEEYQIYYSGLPANCTAETTYRFSYN